MRATPNIIFGFESITSAMIDKKIEHRNVITLQYILIGYLSFFFGCTHVLHFYPFFMEHFEKGLKDSKSKFHLIKKRCHHIFSIVSMVKRIVFFCFALKTKSISMFILSIFYRYQNTNREMGPTKQHRHQQKDTYYVAMKYDRYVTER